MLKSTHKSYSLDVHSFLPEVEEQQINAKTSSDLLPSQSYNPSHLKEDVRSEKTALNGASNQLHCNEEEVSSEIEAKGEIMSAAKQSSSSILYDIHLPVRSLPRYICGIPSMYMKDEWYRLMTFVLYPMDSSISTILLASKGFAYLGNGSDCKVICCFCRVILEYVRCVDDIDEKHQRRTTGCPMVNGEVCDNLPMEDRYPQNGETAFTRFLSSRDSRIQSANKSKSIEENTINFSSSQPSDDSAPSAVVTNTTDLEDDEESNVQSSQIYDEPSPQDNGNTSESQISTETNSNSGVSNETSSTSDSQQDNSHQNDEISNNNEETMKKPLSYEDLGIVTSKPKRPEYAVLSSRLASFDKWQTRYYKNSEDLAKTGFFATGQGNGTRCFHCSGGLRHWEPEDDVLVEHARWFPKCDFLSHIVGKVFINTVQAMNENGNVIKFDDVITRMRSAGIHTHLDFAKRILEDDAAVLAVIDQGFDKNQITKLAMEIRDKDEMLSSDKLFEAAKANNMPVTKRDKRLQSNSVNIGNKGNGDVDEETAKTLANMNTELRGQTMCKVCLDNEVNVVFLPCGHLVSCTNCAFALNSCPLCRVEVKGTVKCYIG